MMRVRAAIVRIESGEAIEMAGTSLFRHGISRARRGRFPRLLGVALIVGACSSTPGAVGQSPVSSIAPTAAAASSSSASNSTSIEPSAATIDRLPVGRIVFERVRGNPEGDFLGSFILDPTGAETRIELPFEPVFAEGFWSPDGTRLLVDTYSDAAGGAVGTFEIASKAYVQLKPKGMADQLECTDWSPDGATVICGRGGPDPADDGIYAVDVATAAVKRLTTSAYHHVTGTAGECGGGEGRAVFSGDGKRFAFEQQKCGNGANPSDDEQGDIVIANADGSGAKVIVPLGDVRTHPGGKISWSPVSDEIAFASQSGVLAIVNADGSGRRTLHLPLSGFLYGPAWSPDGKWILATVNTNGSQRLFAIAADGSRMLRLTKSEDAEAYADWGP
jgi:hypothetical protein